MEYYFIRQLHVPVCNLERMFTYPTPMQNNLFLEECLAAVWNSPSFPKNPSDIRKMLLLPSAGLSKYRDFRGDNTSLQPITGLALWNNNMIIQIFYQMNIHVYYKHTYIPVLVTWCVTSYTLGTAHHVFKKSHTRVMNIVRINTCTWKWLHAFSTCQKIEPLYLYNQI